MAREAAYESGPPADVKAACVDDALLEEESPLQYTYRHGDGTAEILRIELLNASRRKVELVESGEPLLLRARILFYADIEDPVCGFLLRNRHGIHVYGTNSELQEVELGPVCRGEIVEVTFAFDCRLAPDSYSIAVAAHSPDAISFDWVDGALFFQVVSLTQMEGVANLDARVSSRRLGIRGDLNLQRSMTTPSLIS